MKYHLRNGRTTNYGLGYLDREELILALKKFHSQAKTGEYFGVSQMTISRAKVFLNIDHDGKKGKCKKPKKERKIPIGKAWNSGLSNHIYYVCETCGDRFTAPPNRERKFCDRECSAIYFKEIYSDGRYLGNKNPNFNNGTKLKESWKRGDYNNRKLPDHTNGKGGVYNGVWLRSSWEIEYAKHLDKNKITWKYESKRFYLSDGRSYTPDFYLVDTDTYIEVKGYWYEKAKQKFKIFLKEFPEIKIIVEQDNKKWII